MGVLLVGAGISAVACAQGLRSAGLDVRIVDRDPVPGGRMASRHLDGRVVDLAPRTSRWTARISAAPSAR